MDVMCCAFHVIWSIARLHLCRVWTKVEMLKFVPAILCNSCSRNLLIRIQDFQNIIILSTQFIMQ